MVGMIFDIQRFCVDDGPGIRTTVFFKGCPLNCLWCHNPESKKSVMEQYSDTGETIGYHASPEEILAVVLKDRDYFAASGGGMTLSGGEPLLQGAFAAELLSLAKTAGLHTCVETCGFVSQEILREILPYTDLFLYDIKAAPDMHLRYTGQESGRILDNLDFLYRQKAPICLRCPIIPGVNDTGEHFSFLSSLQKQYPRILGMELMPYHNMGVGKAKRLGEPEPFYRENPSPDQIRDWREMLS